MQSQTITGRHVACLTIHIFSLQSPKTHSWAMPHQRVLHLCCKQQPFAQGSLELLHTQVSARPPEGWGWVLLPPKELFVSLLTFRQTWQVEQGASSWGRALGERKFWEQGREEGWKDRQAGGMNVMTSCLGYKVFFWDKCDLFPLNP